MDLAEIKSQGGSWLADAEKNTSFYSCNTFFRSKHVMPLMFQYLARGTFSDSQNLQGNLEFTLHKNCKTLYTMFLSVQIATTRKKNKQSPQRCLHLNFPSYFVLKQSIRSPHWKVILFSELVLFLTISLDAFIRIKSSVKSLKTEKL